MLDKIRKNDIIYAITKLGGMTMYGGYILTTEDINNINALVYNAQILWSNYQALAKLECVGKKNTIEYQNIIEVIRKLLDHEMTLYDKMGSNPSKVCASYQFLYLQSTIFNSNRLETAIDIDNTRIMTERIVRKIDDRLSLYVEVKPKFHQAIEEIGIFDQARLIRTLSSSDEMKHIIPSIFNILELVEADQYECFLVILEKLIQSPFYKEMKEQLILVKYRLAFLCERIEEDLLEKNFEVSPQVYIQAPCITQIKGINMDLHDACIRDMACLNIESQTRILLQQFDDHILSSLSKKTLATLRCCILRMNFLTLDPKTIMDENDRFHSMIESKQYVKTYSDNNQVENMIQSAYRQYKQDKTIPIQVQFK